MRPIMFEGETLADWRRLRNIISRSDGQIYHEQPNSQATEEGRAASVAGRGAHDCPYGDNQPKEACAWLSGFYLKENAKHSAPCESDNLLPQAETVLQDPAASKWLKDAMQSALERDVVDAANDADMLAAILGARADQVLAGSKRV